MSVALYVLCGKSYCGKSTLAAAIARQTGAVIVSLDAINAERGLYGGLGIPDGEWLRSHQLALQRVEEALATGLSVIVDDTNCFRFLRDGYRAVAARLDVQSLLLYLDLPMDALLARASADDPTRPPVASDVLLELVGKFEAPAPEEQAIVVPPGFVPAAWVAQNIGPHR